MKTYKGFTLDEFQSEAIINLNNNLSVIVSAPTGSGKTLIADYLIDSYLSNPDKTDKKLIYTAPIKALSNQKYREFTESFGSDQVGLLTGDFTINPDAPLLIMTTEIYRNMLLAKDYMIDEVSYVIFDEIHYLEDPERGVVWEESIIFSPENVRFLCLSATIPNSDELADWIKTIKKHEVKVIFHDHRPVPLKHSFYDKHYGILEYSELKKLEDDIRFQARRGKRRKRGKGGFRVASVPYETDVVASMKREDLLPCLYFTFSRANTEKKARFVSNKFNFTNPETNKKISEFSRKLLTDHEVMTLKSSLILREVLSKGVAFHHAGMLPIQKTIVEKLFEQGLIKVLFATETFAVGLNMPARAVVFDSLEKFDGRSFRSLTVKEYYQLAGRAGRRGIDKEGTAFVLIDRNKFNPNQIDKLVSGEGEPLRSQFKLSYNTILNMIKSYSSEEINTLLKQNFMYFQKFGPSRVYAATSQSPAYPTFARRRRFLQKNGFLTKNELTEKGFFASLLYRDEILLSELFFKNYDWTEFELFMVVLGICYEFRRGDKFEKFSSNKEIKTCLKKLRKYEIPKNTFASMQKTAYFGYEWFNNCEFSRLLEICNLLEGDIIRLIRQVIDVLSQLRRASDNEDFAELIDNTLDRINRSFIKVEF